jgi:hypothetical protein
MIKLLPAEPKEKRLLSVMIGFFVLAIFTIGKGIYNQSYGINQDRILVPLLLLFFAAFFLTYSFAAFKLHKFVPDSFAIIYPFLIMLIKHMTTLSEEECKNMATRVIGIILLLSSLVFIAFAIFSLITLKSMQAVYIKE